MANKNLVGDRITDLIEYIERGYDNSFIAKGRLFSSRVSMCEETGVTDHVLISEDGVVRYSFSESDETPPLKSVSLAKRIMCVDALLELAGDVYDFDEEKLEEVFIKIDNYLSHFDNEARPCIPLKIKRRLDAFIGFDYYQIKEKVRDVLSEWKNLTMNGFEHAERTEDETQKLLEVSSFAEQVKATIDTLIENPSFISTEEIGSQILKNKVEPLAQLGYLSNGACIAGMLVLGFNMIEPKSMTGFFRPLES